MDLPATRRTCSTRSRRGSSTRSSTSRPTAVAAPRSRCSTPTRCRRSASRSSTPTTSAPTSCSSRASPAHEVELELTLRAAQRYGVTRALVPSEFPVGVADHLRAAGIELVVDPEAFVDKRRVKTEAEIAGIRRAQAAADAAMAVAAEMIHELRPGVTSEEVRAAMQALCDEHGCDLPDDVIVSHGPQGAIGHEAGYGELGRRRARDRRHLAARPRVALLGRHDAHVRGRRRGAAEGDRRVVEAHARVARALVRRGQGGRRRPRGLRGLLRAVRGGGPARPSAASRPARSSTRATSTRSATASASRSTSGRTSAARPTR